MAEPLIGAYTPRTIGATIERGFDPTMYLLNKYVTANRSVTTEHIDIDTITGNRGMATFVGESANPTVTERNGFSTKTITPPFVKELLILTGKDLKKRMAGQGIYSTGNGDTGNLAVKFGKIVKDDIELLVKRMDRLEEWMIAQALTTGGFTITGKGVSATITFGIPAAQNETLTGAALWSATTSTPLNDLDDMRARVSTSSGKMVRDVIMGDAVGASAYKSFKAHADVQLEIDKTKTNNGEITRIEEQFGVVYRGEIDGFRIYTYAGQYWDGSANQYYVPSDKVIGVGVGTVISRNYGAIEDLKSIAAGTHVGRILPKTGYLDKFDEKFFTLLKSRPIVGLDEPDGVFALTVL